MDIYLVMVNDRHTDPTAHPFSDQEAAIDVAREIAQALGDDPLEESTEHWPYLATYATHESAVWVARRALDDRGAWKTS